MTKCSFQWPPPLATVFTFRFNQWKAPEEFGSRYGVGNICNQISEGTDNIYKDAPNGADIEIYNVSSYCVCPILSVAGCPLSVESFGVDRILIFFRSSSAFKLT